MKIKQQFAIIFLMFLIMSINSQLRDPNLIEFIKNNRFELDYPNLVDFDFPTKLQYWSINDVNFEVGRGKTYNSNWNDVMVGQPDTSDNHIMTQVFYSDKNYNRCIFSFRYSAVLHANGQTSYDGLYVNLNGNSLFSIDPIKDLSIHSHSQLTTLITGNNILDVGALGSSLQGYGAVFTDISIKCKAFNNYIFFYAVGNYEFYVNGNIHSSGAVTNSGIEISIGDSVMTNTLIEIKIKSTTVNPKFSATLVYNYDNNQEYLVYTNTFWIVDNLHAEEVPGTPPANPKLDGNSKWIKSSISYLYESIFTIAT